MSNWTKITLLPEGSFVLIIPYMNNGREVYGNWYMRNDTLSLSTDYSHLDMNFVEKGVKGTEDDLFLSIKVYDHHDIDLSDFLFTMIIDSVSFTNDTAKKFIYYDLASNPIVKIPFNTLAQSRGIALIHKKNHFIEYYGSMKEHRDEIKNGHLYDLVFMSLGISYPILENDTYIYVNDTLIKTLKETDSINYNVKYIKKR